MKKLILLSIALAVILAGWYALIPQPDNGNGKALLSPPESALQAPSETMLDIMNVHGTLEYYETKENLIAFRIKSDIVNCELNKTDVSLVAAYSQDEPENILKKGRIYFFSFWKKPEENVWKASIDGRFNIIEEKCRSFHEGDIAISQMANASEPAQTGGAAAIKTTIINPGEPAQLRIALINRQNNEISYMIKDAKFVNGQALQYSGYWWQLPPYGERIRNAIIGECAVNFDSSVSSISANSTKVLAFAVNCPERVDATKSYEICDNYNERINCRTETANGTDNLMLWGEIEFTDELGIKHTIPEKGILIQMLEII